MAIQDLLQGKGTSALIHIEGDAIPCPCRTPEGYRDPEWHKANPLAPECNAAGFLFTTLLEETVMAFVLPASSIRNTNYISQLFGEIRVDDHLGIFPVAAPDGTVFDFSTWSPANENYIMVGTTKYAVVGYSLVPDPDNTSNQHHWELALRKVDPVVANVAQRIY